MFSPLNVFVIVWTLIKIRNTQRSIVIIFYAAAQFFMNYWITNNILRYSLENIFFRHINLIVYFVGEKFMWFEYQYFFFYMPHNSFPCHSFCFWIIGENKNHFVINKCMINKEPYLRKFISSYIEVEHIF